MLQKGFSGIQRRVAQIAASPSGTKMKEKSPRKGYYLEEEAF